MTTPAGKLLRSRCMAAAKGFAWGVRVQGTPRCSHGRSELQQAPGLVVAAPQQRAPPMPRDAPKPRLCCLGLPGAAARGWGARAGRGTGRAQSPASPPAQGARGRELSAWECRGPSRSASSAGWAHFPPTAPKGRPSPLPCPAETLARVPPCRWAHGGSSAGALPAGLPLFLLLSDLWLLGLL